MKSRDGLQLGVRPDAGVDQRIAVAGEPVDARGHVRGAGDGGDDLAAATDEVGDRAMCPAPVVDVDIADRHRPPRPGREDHRDACLGHPEGEGVVVMEAHDEDPVDVAGGHVVGGAIGLRRRRRHQQDELQVAGGQGRTDAAQEAGEERIAEQHAGGLGDDHADRVTTAGDEAAGSPVGDVPELQDGGLDGPADVGADLGGAVDDTGDGRPRDARTRGDLFEGRSVAAVAGRAVRHPVAPSL